MQKKKILIIGGSSFFSINYIKEYFKDFDIVGSYFSNKKFKFNKIKIDISNKKNLLKNIKKIKPHIILNAAGLTNVEKCETNYKEAYKLNVLGVKNLSEICNENNIKLVHISSDHIFDGKKSFYKESSTAKPLNNYALTKVLAEKFVKKLKNSLIIRTNFFGLGYGFSNKFFDMIIKNLSRKKKIYLFDDIFYTPISLIRLTNTINISLKKNLRGVYNISGNERISKYKFGLKVAEIFNYDKKLIVKDYFYKRKNLVSRPKDMSLDNKKISWKLKINLGDVTDNIFDYLNLIKKDKRNEIPYGKHFIFKKDIKKVEEVLKSGAITQGPNIGSFEKKIAKYVGAKYAISVSSCSAGLHLAAKALGIKKNFNLLTTPITFISSANAALNNGSKVFLSDVDKHNALMCTKNLEKNLIKNKSIRAIMPVHFAGATCDMKRINSLAKKFNKFVIEDAAHALGSRYKDNSMVGNCKFSDCTVFSFHPVKTITSGEGGIVTTNNFELYRKILLLRSHGIDKEQFINNKNSKENFRHLPWYYEMIKPGYHYRLTDLQAVLASSQLDSIDQILFKRKVLAKRYDRKLKNFKYLKTIQLKYRSLSSNHLYVIRLDFNKLKRSKKNFFDYLNYHGIKVQVHYIPIYKHPYFKKKLNNHFQNSEKYYEEAVSIPLFYSLNVAQQDMIIKTIHNFIYKFN